MGGQHQGEHLEYSDELDELKDELILSIEGMTCSNCAAKVSRALSSLSDLVDVQVDLVAKEARIHGAHASGIEDFEFTDTVNNLGYKAKLKSTSVKSMFWSRWSTVVAVGSLCTAVMMIGEWVYGWQHTREGAWTLFALATLVQLYCGRAFLKGAWTQAKVGKSDMDTLVALGSWTAYLYSTISFFSQNGTHLYFVEAGAIISLVSLGHFLEAKISERAQSSLKKLIGLQNQQVLRVASDGTQSLVPSAKLKIGDKIALKSGDRIPVDARVESGGAALDESTLSGESLPVDKSRGDLLLSGTLVLDGHLVAMVSAVGRQTALAQIIETVRRAQSSRAAIQKLADRVSSVFVPVVIVIALATFALWLWNPSWISELAAPLEARLWPRMLQDTALSQAIFCAVGVLIIACPCAMGLATPAALMAGTSRAAKNGVLIRDASAIEKSAKITHVFFDKTGTLTRGELSVIKVDGAPTPETLSLAAALASKSKHPISRAIESYAIQQKFPSEPELQKFKEERGRGLSAESGGVPYRLGSLSWHQEVLKISSPLFASVQNSSDSLNVLSRGTDVLAIIHLADQIKPDAAQMIAELRDRGIAVGIISGDREPVVMALAKQLNLDEENVHAEVAPESKALVIEQHQRNGDAVAFVGDGINDAPALKMATLGIAVASASDIAKESADLVLIQNDIKKIPWALEISHRTLRTIKQNLFWAFCYNVLAIPLALLGFVSPILCAAAMGLSDIFVVLNSLRLALYRSSSEVS